MSAAQLAGIRELFWARYLLNFINKVRFWQKYFISIQQCGLRSTSPVEGRG